MDKMPALRKSVIVLPTIRNLCLKTWRSDADIALSHSHIHKGFLFNSSDASGDLRGYTEKGKANKWTDKQSVSFDRRASSSHSVRRRPSSGSMGKMLGAQGRPGPPVPREGTGPCRTQSPISSQEEERSPPLPSALVSCYLTFLEEGDGPDVHVWGPEGGEK